MLLVLYTPVTSGSCTRSRAVCRAIWSLELGGRLEAVARSGRWRSRWGRRLPVSAERVIARVELQLEGPEKMELWVVWAVGGHAWSADIFPCLGTQVHED